MKRKRAPADRSGLSLAVGLGLAACGSGNSTTEHASGPTASSPTSKPTSKATSASSSAAGPSASSAPKSKGTPAAEEWAPKLDAHAVKASDLATRVLYTWTSSEQATAIKQGSPLFTKIVSSLYGPSSFDWSLQAAADQGDEIAELLRAEGFAQKRFAWPNPYGAMLGGAYGNTLMRVELAADAIIVDLAHRRAVVVDGTEVPFDTLTSKAKSIAAVYWENDGFREYVLVNESKVARVSFGTPETAAAFQDARDFVNGLVKAVRQMSETEANAAFVRYEEGLVFRAGVDLPRLTEHDAILARFSLDNVSFDGPPKVRTFTLGKTRAALKDDCKTSQSGDYSYRYTVCSPQNRCSATPGNKCVAIKRMGITLPE